MIRIFEQALNRQEVIVTCLELGYKFIEHFNKCLNSQNSSSVHHWCSEMQSWYNQCKNLKFKHSKKQITKQQLYNYFLLCGSGLDVLFEDEVARVLYDEFSQQLLKRDDVYNCMKDILD